MPIFFEDENGILSLSLKALIDGERQVLRDADDPAPKRPLIYVSS